MAQIFPPGANPASRLSLLGALVLGALALLTLMMIAHTSYSTGVGRTLVQPLQFSHKHHVQGLGLDCRYCHTQVERAANAGYPDTWTCMGCHSQVWTQAEMLASVRRSLKDDVPLNWNRVHNLPDHVYFDHSIHVNKGVGCVECHGRVSEMPTVQQVQPLSMRFCLDCHKSPEEHLRPVDQIVNEDWRTSDPHLGVQLMQQNSVHRLSVRDCNLCHR